MPTQLSIHDAPFCLVRFAKTAGKEARDSWIKFTKDFFISRHAFASLP
jgi:hypothetical protein